MATSPSKRTHCNNGHDLAIFGTYKSKSKTSKGGVCESYACKECKRGYAVRHNRRVRAMRKGLPVPATAPTHDNALEPMRVERITALIDAKWLASTKNERDEIQGRIDSLTKGITA